MCDFWISRNHRRSEFPPELTVEHKIEIFRDRVSGWQIEIAEGMFGMSGSGDHCGFAVVAVLFSYFEMLAQHILGESSDSRSRNYNGTPPTSMFVNGYRELYPNTQLNDTIIRAIYRRVRCGMYHSGHTRLNTLLSGEYPRAVDFDENDDLLMINPHRLVEDIRAHFDGYMARLGAGNSQTLIDHFETMFDNGLEEE